MREPFPHQIARANCRDAMTRREAWTPDDGREAFLRCLEIRKPVFFKVPILVILGLFSKKKKDLKVKIILIHKESGPRTRYKLLKAQRKTTEIFSTLPF